MERKRDEKMDLVVDANIIFAALVKEGITIELLLEPQIHLFAPEYLFDEILKHGKELIEKTERKPEELEEVLELLKQRIVIIPSEEFKPFLEEARMISPDPGDVPYIALAIKLKIPIWSNDRDLKEKQNVVKVYNTKDILR